MSYRRRRSNTQTRRIEEKRITNPREKTSSSRTSAQPHTKRTRTCCLLLGALVGPGGARMTALKKCVNNE
jgi:hypothetical protein